MKKFDVTALGELLVDFTENGRSAQGNPIYEANPGGAPCNVLSMLQKLGKKTAFIGKVGNDAFGSMLIHTAKEQGINTDSLSVCENVPTTLAFVHTGKDGDRSFSFYRNPGADMMLRHPDVDEKLLADTKIFHFGTLSMTDSEISETTKKAVENAQKAGAVISFDPNYRPLLWNSEADARAAMWYGITQCEILKISDDEIEFLTGERDIDKGIRIIMSKTTSKLICATMGKNGSKAYYGGKSIFCPAFSNKNTIETTGAGDTFMACVLNFVLEKGIDGLTGEDLAEMLRFAGAAASIITTRKGALRVMPEKEEVEAFLREAGQKNLLIL